MRPLVGRRSARSPAWPAALAALGLAFVVGPVAAVSGPTSLRAPSVEPRSAPPGTPVTLEVTYVNHEGSAPAYVRVVVGAAAYPMSGSGSDFKAGVRFTVVVTPPSGTHAVRFEAADTRKFSAVLDAGTIRIEAAGGGGTPTPVPSAGSTPTPTPVPSPGPTPTPPAPTGSPAPTGTPEPTETSPRVPPSATPAPSPRPGEPPASIVPGAPDPPGSSGPVAQPPDASTPPGPLPGSSGSSDAGSGSSGPSSGSIGDSDGSPGEGPTGDGSPPAWTARVASRFGFAESARDEVRLRDPSGAQPPAPVDGVPGSGDGSRGAYGGGDHPLVGSRSAVVALSALPPWLGRGGPLPFGTTTVLVTSTGAVTLTMAFLLFGKRRRDGEPPAADETLAAEAARGSGIVPGSGLAVPGVPPDPEAHLPRWRRPSLLAARKADPIRDPTAGGQRLTFGQGLVAPPPGAERRRIRYHLVRLLDAPDEIRAGEIGMLDQGDEVALLERSGVYWRVQCPDGREGWIHKMTLGEAIAERDEVADAAWASAPADLPETSWSARRDRSVRGGPDGPPGVVPGGADGPTEVDDYVLRAFLQTRRLSKA